MRGTIRQRGEAWTWQHEYTSNAKRRYKTGTETTKRAAQKALNASLAAHDTGAHQVDPTKMTMAEYLRGWLDVKKLKVRPNTWRGYADHVDHLIAIIGDTKLSELAAPEIARCISQLREQGRCDGTGGLSGTTAQHVLRTLNTALRAAVKSHKIVRNPLDDLDDNAKPRRERVELVVWTADELGRFLTSTRHDRLHPLWVTAATTALRRGELAGLKWADLDLDGRAAALSVRRSRTQVRYEVHEDAPKNAKARVVALDAATVEVLKAWHQRQREERMAFGPGRVDSGYVFTREDGTPLHPAAITNGFDRAVRRSGLPQLHLHGLRHSWATISLAAGTNVKVVQERLGHHSPAFTLSVYAHVLPGMQAEAAEAFAGLVLGGQQSARPVTL
ncbi:MAG TPA: site-specific integrase [Acidimicrobiales bacterium]|nr:site-specific integrase [Acidimicrobiales bacterium]